MSETLQLLADITNRNELVRTGKVPCERCGRALEMYYRPWCPVCDKPEKQCLEELNLIQALSHLEAIGNVGISDRVVKHLNQGGHLRNDAYIRIDLSADMKEEVGESHYKDLMVMKQVFDLGDSILLWVSW